MSIMMSACVRNCNCFPPSFDGWISFAQEAQKLSDEQARNVVELFRNVVKDDHKVFEDRLREWKEPLELTDENITDICAASKRHFDRFSGCESETPSSLPAPFAQVEKMAEETANLAMSVRFLAHEGNDVKSLVDDLNLKASEMRRVYRRHQFSPHFHHPVSPLAARQLGRMPYCGKNRPPVQARGLPHMCVMHRAIPTDAVVPSSSAARPLPFLRRMRSAMPIGQPHGMPATTANAQSTPPTKQNQ